MPVDISLSMVMRLLGMPGLCSPGPFLDTAAPTDISPIGAHAVAGLVLVFLIMTIREL